MIGSPASYSEEGGIGKRSNKEAARSTNCSESPDRRASPRASIAILRASKAFAAMSGRDFVTPEDIKRAAIPVLHHRVIVTPEREMEGITSKEIIKQIIETVEIPR